MNIVKRRGKKTFIVDATPVDVDINFHRNKKTKEHLEKLISNGVIHPLKVIILDLKRLLY